MVKRVVLIDAYPIIFGSYYAMLKKPMRNSKGENTSIIYGFINKLEMILKDYSPSHVAVVFDSASKTFRHEAYPEYKAQRDATPEDIHKSVPIIKRIVESFNIAQFAVDGYEADDIVGTLAKKASAEGYEVLMVTPDKDYAQLVDDNIKMLRITHGNGLELLDKSAVCDKWSLTSPAQMIDHLALVGDASDNIPGCKGIGEKTAATLLAEYGNVENLLDNAANIKGAVSKKLLDGAEMTKFSKFLVTICTDVPLDVKIEDLVVKERNYNQMLSIYKEYELKSFISKYTQNFQLSKLFDNEILASTTQATLEYSNLSELSSISHDYQLIENENDIDKFLPKILCQKKVCFDTETTSSDVFSADLVGMSFSFEKNKAFFVILPEERVECQKVLEKFRPFFENEEIEKIGQNLKFDILVLRQYGISVKGKKFDTMIAHYLIQPEERHGMDYMAEKYLEYKTITYEELTQTKNGKGLPLRSVDKTRLCDYAAEDADITYQLYEIFDKELKNQNLYSLFDDLEMPLMDVLVEMETSGARVDVNALQSLNIFMKTRLEELIGEIFQLAGCEFNVSSPKQVGEVLFNKLSLADDAKKTKTGQFSTSEESLLALKSKHPIVGLILEYRGIKKLLNTYVEALPQLINPRTDKIHCSFNQTVTATGRLSSSNPNLQNIPVRDELGKEIRKCFVPDKGCKFISADYSQIELRVMAHASGDQNMIDAFNSGYDFHTQTAAKIYGVATEEVTKDMRRKAKTANFGILYGISVFGLSERLDINRDEAKELISQYFLAYPRMKEYLEETKQFARDHCYVETLFGRRRYIQDINSRNGTIRQMAERNAINAPIQGTAADIIKVAMIRIIERIKNEGLKSQMIIQVHDELNFNVPESEVDIMQKIIVEEMEGAFSMKVPLSVECIVADNWLDAH